MNNNDLLCLTRPELVEDIHYAYAAAGADIIETNTFNGTRLAQDDFNMSDHVPEINTAAAILAKRAAERVSKE